MAYFAQVGAHPTSSKSDGASVESAFDPLASHKYSQPPAPSDTPVQSAALDPLEAGFPRFGYSQTSAADRNARAEPQFGGAPTSPGFGAVPREQAPFEPAAEEYSDAYSDAYDDAFTSDEDGLYGPAPRGDLNKAATALGAVLSLGLVVGLSIWGYKLIMRDVTGVPVVSAVSGPLRVQPDDPGGQLADHQGLAVNAVAASGTAEAPADTLRLAPDAIALTEDDQPLSAMAEAPADALSHAETIALAGQSGGTSVEATLGTPLSDIERRSQDIDALVAALTETEVPLDALQETSVAPAQGLSSPQVSATQPAAVVIETVPESVLNAPGVRSTPRPQVRPARFSPAPVVTAPSATVEAAELDPATIAVGTRLAQLGAYESAEVARSEWGRISGKFGDFFEGKQRVVQRAESGGRIFYRLRAHGFADLSDARRFCSALVAGNADCIPVSMR